MKKRNVLSCHMQTYIHSSLDRYQINIYASRSEIFRFVVVFFSFIHSSNSFQSKCCHPTRNMMKTFEYAELLAVRKLNNVYSRIHRPPNATLCISQNVRLHSADFFFFFFSFIFVIVCCLIPFCISFALQCHTCRSVHFSHITERTLLYLWGDWSAAATAMKYNVQLCVHKMRFTEFRVFLLYR